LQLIVSVRESVWLGGGLICLQHYIGELNVSIDDAASLQ